MKKIMIILLMVLCASFVCAIEYDFSDYKVVSEGDHTFITYPAGDLSFLMSTPYVEVVSERLFLPGTRDVIDLDVKLEDPVTLDLNLPLVGGMNKDDFEIYDDIDCDSEIIAGAEITSTSYKEGSTEITFKVNPLNKDSCGKYTFYKEVTVDFVYSDPVITYYIDFDYPIREGANDLEVHFSSVPDGELVIYGDYVGEYIDDEYVRYEELLRESVDEVDEEFELVVDGDSNSFQTKYFEDGDEISKYVITNIIPWGDFDFVIKEGPEPENYTLIIEINNTLQEKVTVSFSATLLSKEVEYEYYENLTADVSFNITADQGIDVYEQPVSIPKEVEGVYLKGSAYSYSHETANNMFAVYKKDIDTSEGLPPSPVEMIIEESKKGEVVEKEPSKSRNDMIAIVIAIIVLLLIAGLYYYYFVKE